MSKPSDDSAQPGANLDDELPVGPGASFTFLYYFATAAGLTALLTAKIFGVGLATGLPGQFAVLGGGIVGILGVLFNRSQTLEVPWTNKKKFRQQFNQVLNGWGYSQTATEGSIARYEKPNASRFFAGDIYVQERDQSTIFVSRAANIRKLKRQLDG